MVPGSSASACLEMVGVVWFELQESIAIRFGRFTERAAGATWPLLVDIAIRL